MSDFVVRPFAFMRVTHEAVRADFAAIERADFAAIERADFAAIERAAGDGDRVQAEPRALKGVIALHAKQNEVFFPMLDRLFDGAAENAGGPQGAGSSKASFTSRQAGEQMSPSDAWPKPRGSLISVVTCGRSSGTPTSEWGPR